LNVDFGSKWRAEHVDTAIFHTRKDIDRLIAETEAVVTRDLEHGDRQRAMKRLRVPPLGEQLSPWITFKVGLFSGAFVILFIAVILSGKQNENFFPFICITLTLIFQLCDIKRRKIGRYYVEFIVGHFL